MTNAPTNLQLSSSPRVEASSTFFASTNPALSMASRQREPAAAFNRQKKARRGIDPPGRGVGSLGSQTTACRDLAVCSKSNTGQAVNLISKGANLPLASE